MENPFLEKGVFHPPRPPSLSPKTFIWGAQLAKAGVQIVDFMSMESNSNVLDREQMSSRPY
jgi:hypothetical protein